MKRHAPEVENFYEKIDEKENNPLEDNPNYKVHGIKIPFRMLIIGASGSMKTNSALDICKKFDQTFHHITVVTRNIEEPLYKYLRSKIPPDQLTIVEVEDEDTSKIPKLGDSTEATGNEPHTLIIFDDLVLLQNQKRIKDYYIRCRKFHISAMYLTQSYFGVPKTIRGQSTVVIFKKIVSKRDLRLILSDYSLSTDLEQLEDMYKECTNEPTSWLMIQVQNPPGQQFYRNYTCIDENQSDNELEDQPDDEETESDAPPEEEVTKPAAAQLRAMFSHPKFRLK